MVDFSLSSTKVHDALALDVKDNPETRHANRDVYLVEVAIAIIAGGLSIIQKDGADQDFYRLWHDYLIGVLPMACVLAFGLIMCLVDL